MKKINAMLRKCKTLSRQLGRSSTHSCSVSSVRCNSIGRELMWNAVSSFYGGDCKHEEDEGEEEERAETVYVGKTMKRYVISSKYLSHPLIIALLQKSSKPEVDCKNLQVLVINCEVVLFDHLLWMLENADLNLTSSDSLDELADLYSI